MDEAKMTDADMAQREKIVKSMKKNFKDFRSRYGSRAKEVMYATATKMAMKEDAIEENKYSLPAGSMKPETPAKPKSYLEKRFGHLKPGESASLKGDPKEVKKPMKEDAIEEGEVKKANKEKKNAYVASIIQKKLHPSVLPSTAYGRRKLKEEHPAQGSSVTKVPYKVMDMDNLVQDAIKDIPEDDGPHTSTVADSDAINFQTVAKPEDVVNQANNEGNRESTAVTALRKTGKPFKAIRSRGPKSYGPEDLSGALASVAIGEGFDDYKDIAQHLVKKHGKNVTKKHIDDFAKTRDSRSSLDHDEVMSHVRNVKEAVKDEADKGEYDYEGDMAKSSLRTIIRNAQMMHDMLDENTNLPEWVASKVTLAEDYIVAAAQYMQSEMSEEVELDEISSYKASRAADASWHMNT